MFASRPIWAKNGKAFEGKRYGITSTWYGEGEVFSYDENRTVLKFRNERTPDSELYGLIWLPKFLVLNNEGVEMLQFQRVRRLIRSEFEIRDTGNRVGTVVQRNLFCTGYELRLLNGEVWDFRLPLFATGFFGSSAAGGKLLFWLKSHRQWQLVICSGHDSEQLLASLAFLHRERLRHQ